MIVKTGANYQAEGGYIEASKDNDTVVVTIGNDSVEIPSIKGIVDTMVKCDISKGPETPAGGIYTGIINPSASSPYMAGGSALPSYPNHSTIGLLFHIGTPITFTNNRAKLLDGSKDCVLKDGTGNTKILFATGDNPVAVIGVEG